MKRWPIKPLGEVCAINPKLSAAEAPATDADISFIPMAAVDEMSGSIARPEIRQYGQVKKGYTPFRENDVLFAKITPCMENGKAAIARGLRGSLGFGSTEFHVIRPTAALLPEWVFALIRQPSFRDTAKANFTGTAGQQRVPADFLKSFPIPVPPLAEQERIVKLLDEAGELRKLRTQADHRTADLIPALFHEMFSDQQGGELSLSRLGDISEIKSGAGFPLEKQGLLDQPIPFFKVGDMNTPGNESEMHIFRHSISEDIRKELGAVLLPTGSVIFPKVGAAIATNKKRVLVRPSCVDNNVMAVIPGDKLKTEFLFALFAAKNLSEFASESNPPSIRKTTVEDWQIPLPPIALQKEFSQRVTEIRALETAQAKSRERLEALFQSLLHRAFNGEL